MKKRDIIIIVAVLVVAFAAFMAVNLFQFKDGKVYMADSTCENQDCVDQGTMTEENVDTRPMRNWIVCLPNGISIELRLASEETT